MDDGKPENWHNGGLRTMREMKIGDEVLIDSSRENIFHFAKQLGFKIKTRKEFLKYRVWRVE